MFNRKKRVSWSETEIIGDTYSPDDYDRSIHPDTLIYKRAKRRVTDMEFALAIRSLNLYKTYEMQVHKASMGNTTLKMI